MMNLPGLDRTNLYSHVLQKLSSSIEIININPQIYSNLIP